MPSSQSQWRGVFVIVTTPFKDDLSLDETGLRNTVRFCLESGVHGLVSTANASEVGYLTDEERRRSVKIIVEETAGRATVLAGCSASCAFTATRIAKHAAETGVDGIMAMPPTVNTASAAEIRAFYEALADATDLPVMLQNFAGPSGTYMSPALMAEMVREIDGVDYVKEETTYSSVLMTEVMDLAGPGLKGVMGGKAGIKLLDECRRGACGTMPACEVADVHVALWNALEAGDMALAKRIYHVLMPLLSFEVGYGPAVYKRVLHRRGVIGTPLFRQTGGRVLDDLALVELDDILSDLAPFMSGPREVAAQ
ncbi:dihydrodipicolinate synthase family protein [Boseongicola sp. H5]|uniref:dihydrodipicolinate synthase family protein n=1 Tax=Boseongicola sp. H5 TaxID=2763261 RepID=UPI001D0BD180|nr:dihydrodipicolinate synthase family protein [Boseongicola sp. H5]